MQFKRLDAQLLPLLLERVTTAADTNHVSATVHLDGAPGVPTLLTPDNAPNSSKRYLSYLTVICISEGGSILRWNAPDGTVTARKQFCVFHFNFGTS